MDDDGTPPPLPKRAKHSHPQPHLTSAAAAVEGSEQAATDKDAVSAVPNECRACVVKTFTIGRDQTTNPIRVQIPEVSRRIIGAHESGRSAVLAGSSSTRRATADRTPVCVCVCSGRPWSWAPSSGPAVCSSPTSFTTTCATSCKGKQYWRCDHLDTCWCGPRRTDTVTEAHTRPRWLGFGCCCY